MISINLFCCLEQVFILMNLWIIQKNFNETSLPKKEQFYINLNIEDMVDSDCNHTKKICKDFEINKKFRQML